MLGNLRTSIGHSLQRGPIVGVLLSLVLTIPAGATTFFMPSSPSQGAFVEPRLRIGSGDHLYLIWVGRQNKRPHHVFLNRSSDGGHSWQPESVWLDVDKAEGSWSSSPQLHTDGRGGVYVAWRMKHRDGRKDVLFTASEDFGRTFGPRIKLNQEHGAFEPALSADGKGHVYVVWSDERVMDQGQPLGKGRGSHHIYFNRSDDAGKSWLEREVRLNSDDPDPSMSIMRAWPIVHSNPDGHVYVAWFDNRDGDSAVYFRASDDYATTWRAEQRLKVERHGDILGPLQMVADAQGHIYLTWADNREGEFSVYVTTSADFGQTWSKEVRLDRTKTKAAPSTAPVIACDETGHVYVAWHDARHGGWDIYLNISADFGRTWRAEEIRLNSGPPGESEALFPHIALDGTGRVAIVWQENRGPEQEEGIYLTWSADFGKIWQPTDLRVDDQRPGHTGFNPQIAMLKEGAFVVAWEANHQDRQAIALKVFNPKDLQTVTRSDRPVAP
ncbi:MAG TPA: sialidase family protein [Alphaproteobacteria bacterium]|nr:sialidase family protein [Alphaproteobacteria bacterium]